MYDAIVVGTGGVGSAALFHLAQRGRKVLGIDRFPGGHDRGSSHGQTRIIRQAYFEHVDYVPLLRRAYELWQELQRLIEQQLYFETGLVECGPPDGVVIPGVLSSASRHQLEIQQLTRSEAQARFPCFQFPDGDHVVFEPRAGYLRVEECVLAHLAAAKQHGAELCVGESVMSWQVDGSGVVVNTDRSEYRAGALVLTAGAWSGDLLAKLGIPLHILIKHLHWYETGDPRMSEKEGCPTFFFEVPGGYYYGFPQLDARGIKLAEHSGGVKITDPLHANRCVDTQERQRVEQFLATCLPSVQLNPTDHATCFYTMSPDEHFVVDVHPEHRQVAFTAGLSGHGFKFTPVLGEILAELADSGQTSHPIEFLRCDRPALVSPPA